MEDGLPGWPALVGKHSIVASAAVVLIPVDEGQLQLCHLRQNLWIGVARCTELLGHVGGDSLDLLGTTSHLLELTLQVELRVLLNLYAEVIEWLDRCVASQEVEWTRTETEHLQVAHADDDAGNVTEVGQFLDGLLWCNVWILRNIDTQTAHTDVVAEVEHAAQRVTTVGGEVGLALFLGSQHHSWALELLDEHGGWTLWTEVAEEHADGVDAILLSPCQGLHRVILVLDGDRTVVHFWKVSLAHLSHEGGQTGLRQGDREAVTAYTYDTQFHNRLIDHCCFEFVIRI